MTFCTESRTSQNAVGEQTVVVQVRNRAHAQGTLHDTRHVAQDAAAARNERMLVSEQSWKAGWSRAGGPGV